MDHAKLILYSEITGIHDLVPVRLSVNIGVRSHGVRSRFIGFALPVAVYVRPHLQPDL